MTENLITTGSGLDEGSRRTARRRFRTLALSVVLAAAAVACAPASSASPDDDPTSDPAEAPEVTITALRVGDDGDAVLEYAFEDDGPVRVEIDWGDGSPLQGFTSESGSFTSQHVYDSVTTSVVVTVVTIDAEGNSSADTRSVDLGGTATTATTEPPTTPATTEPPTTATPTSSTTAPPTSATTAPPATTTTTTTAPPPPPPPPAPTTTTTTTTTTAPPRNYRVTVSGDVVRVVGDCDSIGQGDFVIAGSVDTDRSEPDSFTIGRVSNTEQLDDGETRSIASTRTVTGGVPEDVLTEWGAFFTVTEYDPIQQPDPNMNARTESTGGVISTARSPFSQTLTVGAGSCRVDMTILVTAEFVD